ncbi:PaaI family thioesterase [Actinomycetospora aeridis]|uniref:Acyl-coenzyme A thioesterase THEM4 n=1 Tax=Actinomycetospora aeridis TaxID=3129231 RepID=A0ABU8N7H5_9PSEU
MGNVWRVPISIDPPADAEPPQRNPKAPAPGERTTSHYEGCRGCGDVPGSLRVRSWVGDDGISVVSRFDVLDEHQGAPGLLHGGMLMTAFDDALGTAYTQVTRSAVTARLETDFRRPVPVGTTLWLRSRVDAKVGRKIYVSGSAHLGGLDGEVAGTARALFLKVGVEHFLRHGRPEDLEALGASREVIEAARAAP